MELKNIISPGDILFYELKGDIPQRCVDFVGNDLCVDEETIAGSVRRKVWEVDKDYAELWTRVYDTYVLSFKKVKGTWMKCEGVRI